MGTMDVAIVMGSKSDLHAVSPAARTLAALGLTVMVKILSAHRTPDILDEFIKECEKSEIKVYIAAAGGAAHLAGTIAAKTVRPVIGIPVKTDLGGLDSLLSTVQMPSGVPVATVAVNGAKNAALLAAQMIAISNPELTLQLSNLRAEQRQEVIDSNEVLGEYHL